MKTEIIPVIHVITKFQAYANAKLCLSLGINKVFLISHRGSNEALVELAHEMKNIHPELWVGVNLLGVPTIEALTMPELDGLDGIWSDVTITPTMADKRTFKGQFFGGVAFKYQPQPDDLKTACEEAILATDVATTSGDGTGIAADDSKIHSIREYLGFHPMAIASGVNAENAKIYKDKVNYLLVASSITDRGEMINEDALKELIASIA